MRIEQSQDASPVTSQRCRGSVSTGRVTLYNTWTSCTMRPRGCSMVISLMICPNNDSVVLRRSTHSRQVVMQIRESKVRYASSRPDVRVCDAIFDNRQRGNTTALRLVMPSTLFRLPTAPSRCTWSSQPKHRHPAKPCAEHTPKTSKLVCFRMPLISNRTLNRTLDLTATFWLTTLNRINREP